VGKPQPEPSEIGSRARAIRKRRGLKQAFVADQLGYTAGYLSLLEQGKREFSKRGLLEDLAGVLGCAVADLTGQPYLPHDRASAEALASLPQISLALYEATLDDVPDIPARPLDELVRRAAIANEHTANSRYAEAGRDLGKLVTELHIHAVTGSDDTRRAALPALVEACFVCSGTARALGNTDLAVAAARRAEDAARLVDDAALRGFAAMTSTSALSRAGARYRAQRVAATALTAIEPLADPSAPDTSAAEASGMLHLSAAQMAAKDQRVDDAHAHLAAARDLAAHTGERNQLQFSFGPTNVTAWSLSVAVELGEGPALAEHVDQQPGFGETLPTRDRRAALHFDLARAYTQAEGARDTAAVRHLDLADRIAPQRLRNDPVAREIIHTLDQRAKLDLWELDSLKNRLGVGLHSVNN
jgi:transcriptional regulator with XRE-family HTH domain